jgi:hypothetical protein
MASSPKKNSKTQRQASGTLVAIGLVVLGVIVCLVIPVFQDKVKAAIIGWKGLVYLLGAGFVLEAWFLIIGYRGKALLYALGILVFTILCIWLAVNFNLVWDSMVNTLGLWPTIIITLLGALGLWFVVKVLF